MGWRKTLHLLFTGQNHIRILAVNNSCEVEALPQSIYSLKHLRYLEFSRRSIKRLPESITSLPKLQTLKLCYCKQLRILPKHMKYVESLVYLRNEGCISLPSMPAGMGQLTYLRRLDHLGGGLIISDLGNVKDLTDAKSADLMRKTILQSSTLSGHGNGDYLSGILLT
ncbi:hypothetical protein NC652_010951 [Populus alba x Populus x berolinensis]|nr:hypothetical protein NC652_010951 [Populus alba x Populus x berolinensis]